MRASRKMRRTFTLSPENLAYLDAETRRRNAGSQSAVLDELLQEKTREQKLAEIEANIGAYYDSLTDAEMEEDRLWGKFAGRHLVLNEEELAHAQSAAGGNLVHQDGNRPTGKRKAPGSDRVRQRTKQSSAR